MKTCGNQLNEKTNLRIDMTKQEYANFWVAIMFNDDCRRGVHTPHEQSTTITMNEKNTWQTFDMCN